MVRNNLEFSLGVYTSLKQEDSSCIGGLRLYLFSLFFQDWVRAKHTIIPSISDSISRIRVRDTFTPCYCPPGSLFLGVLFSWLGIVATTAPQIVMWKECGIVEN